MRALELLVEVARAAGWTLCLHAGGDAASTGSRRARGWCSTRLHRARRDLCIALGGDGTILHGLRAYAGTGVPVFGINFGEVGFLATVEPDGVTAGVEPALRGEFDTLQLPGIEVTSGEQTWLAMNDVSFHRQQGLRVADLAFDVADEEVGRVRCDGLVIATPAGSTGYNLANGGPVMAWGVEGLAVSFIAPHSLTARALVVAPQDAICRPQPLAGGAGRRQHRRPSEVRAGAGRGRVSARFKDGVGTLAQVPGASFYHRLREKFGRLANGV